MLAAGLAVAVTGLPGRWRRAGRGAWPDGAADGDALRAYSSVVCPDGAAAAWRRPARPARDGPRPMLAALGVAAGAAGPAPRPGSLLVANHVSWLDVLALLAVAPVRLVAKREVRLLAGHRRAGRAVRGDLHRPVPAEARCRSTVAEVTAALRAGRTVAAFPEGTTFCGADARPLPVRRCSRRRSTPARRSCRSSISYDTTAAAFIGDDTLVASVRRVAALRAHRDPGGRARPAPDARRRPAFAGPGRPVLARGVRLPPGRLTGPVPG